MKNVNEIKARIGGVQDTLKITKAMYIIAAAKMPRCMQALAAGRVYHAAMQRAVSRMMCPRFCQNPYLVGNPQGKNTGWIVIAGDKGLCGDYNQRVLDEAWSRIENSSHRKIFAVGYEAREYFRAKGCKVNNAFVHMMQNPLIDDAGQIAERIMNDLAKDALRKVYVVYTAANRLHDQQVVCEQLLPIPFEMQEENVTLSNPDQDGNELIFEYLQSKLYCVLLEASAALNYKHMTGMQQSAHNGEEMLQQLTQNYNHARQAAITSELNDVNGARAANEDRP